MVLISLLLVNETETLTEIEVSVAFGRGVARAGVGRVRRNVYGFLALATA